MLQKNQLITLEITDMTHEGSGVGHMDGIAVFVPKSAVGDLLKVKILKVNRTHCYGKIEQIITPSSDRIRSDCPVSRRCGGCTFRHVSYEAELRYKQEFVQSNLKRIGGFDLKVEPIAPSPKQDEYRNKAQYPIRMQKNKLCAGFFAPRTHEVIDCHDCKLQPKSFEKILNSVLSFVNQYKLSIYDEKNGTGLLRHVYLRYGQETGEIMVCLVINGSELPNSDELVKTLLACDSNIVSIVFNINTQNTNVILGKKNKLLYGSLHISDTLCGIKFDLSPLAFYQVNHDGAQQLYEIAADYAQLSKTDTLLDLYCGAGTIGLSMANKCKKVIGVEIIPQAIENATENAKKNNIENARFLCADAAKAAENFAQEGVRPNVVIVDPPRKGCELSVLQSIAKMNPQRIVMVSCNSATMARDCAILRDLGYTLQKCKPVDMFPRTTHVECVVLMTKCGSEDKK